MSVYINVNIYTKPELYELLSAELFEMCYEGFVENDDFLQAFIPQNLFDKDALIELLNHYNISKENLEFIVIEQQNWNKIWESGFEPIVIEPDVAITAPFHNTYYNCKYHIIIQPKTSFGTGHHETTRLMMKMMLRESIKDKIVLDYGSGTGILAIFASVLGSKHIDAIDIDDWAAENIYENMQLNNVDNITFQQTDLKNFYAAVKYDIILANINKNILLESFEKLAFILKTSGKLMISGFYASDLDELKNNADKFGLKFIGSDIENIWCCALFEYNFTDN